jgi:K+-transporting ATPase ATPase C chain
MLGQLMPALRLTVVFTVLTGLVYPGVVTALSQLFFPRQANGSLISRDDKVVGSSLIGQGFTRPEYFHGRPSSAGANGYDASASSGSNLGPTSQKLFDGVKSSVEQFRKDNPDFSGSIPADMLTASGSGLDPHISPASALAQVNRVAKARQADPDQIEQLVRQATEGRDLGFLGEPRANVLKLNLALDRQFPRR